jgi:hypothetical protein
MIAVRFLHREEWEPRLRRHGYKPLDGKGPLNTADWWITPSGRVFTVPCEEGGRCDEWAINKLILDLMGCS